jgi:deoxyxylulose-5-phosphate synthase
VAHPFFAPTILDGGVTRFATGRTSEQVISGFLRAAETDHVIRDANASAGHSITAFTFLAGSQHADRIREGIEKAISTLGPTVEPRDH